MEVIRHGVWLLIFSFLLFKKRLKALEEKVASEGIILSDAQIAAIEKKKQDDEACGEIETAHPGYLGFARHFLCWQSQRCWQDLPANFC